MKNKFRSVVIGLTLGGGLVLLGLLYVNKTEEKLNPRRMNTTWGTTFQLTYCDTNPTKDPVSKRPCIPYSYKIGRTPYLGHSFLYNVDPSPDSYFKVKTMIPAGTKIKVTYDSKFPEYSYVDKVDLEKLFAQQGAPPDAPAAHR